MLIQFTLSESVNRGLAAASEHLCCLPDEGHLASSSQSSRYYTFSGMKDLRMKIARRSAKALRLRLVNYDYDINDQKPML